MSLIFTGLPSTINSSSLFATEINASLIKVSLPCPSLTYASKPTNFKSSKELATILSMTKNLLKYYNLTINYAYHRANLDNNK